MINSQHTPENEPSLSFEEAMRELEELVAALEDGQAPLEKSLQLVQRGRELSEQCEKILKTAELTLTQLTTSSEGELIEEPLDWEQATE